MTVTPEKLTLALISVATVLMTIISAVPWTHPIDSQGDGVNCRLLVKPLRE